MASPIAPATALDPSAPPPAAGSVSRVKVRTKLILVNVALAVVALGFFGAVAYAILRESVQKNVANQFTAVRVSFSRQINDYFQSARAQIASQAESASVQTALNEFTAARRSLFQQLTAEGFNAADPAFTLSLDDSLRRYYEDNLISKLALARGTAERENADLFLPRDREARLLQFVYTVKNPASPGQKFLNNATTDIIGNEGFDRSLREAFYRSDYAVANNRHHPYFRAIAERFGYEDIYLIDPDGNVVYSLAKELDFATSVRPVPGRTSALGDLFAAAWYADPSATADLDSRVMISDFVRYDVTYDNAAVFMSTPVSDNMSRSLGVLVFRLSLAKIYSILNAGGRPEDAGLGQTGEAFLVGRDFRLRSDVRYPEQLLTGQRRVLSSRSGDAVGATGVLAATVDSNAARAVFSDAPDAAPASVGTYQSYRGEEVLGAFGPLSVAGLDLGLIVEQTSREAFSQVRDLLRFLLIIGGIVLLIVAIFSIITASAVLLPLSALTRVAGRIAGGDNSVRAPELSRDEIGLFASSFNQMVDARVDAQEKAEKENALLQADIRQMLEVVSDAADGDLTVRAHVTEGALGNVADAFNLMMENIADTLKQVVVSTARVNTAAQTFRDSSESMAQGAAEQATQIGFTTLAMNQITSNLKVVSLNAESANSAADEARRSAEAGDAAVREVVAGMERIRRAVQAGARKIKRLGERSMEITSIVNSIQSISQQTDMLALNASIEASRAGEEGRGFAIVAEDIRKLAERAQAAAREIETLVSTIQGDTNEAVIVMEEQTSEVEREARVVSSAGQELEHIRHSITESAMLISAMNTAAKEQADGASHVLEAMNVVQTIAEHAEGDSRRNRENSVGLTVLADDLLKSVAQFKVEAARNGANGAG